MYVRLVTTVEKLSVNTGSLLEPNRISVRLRLHASSGEQLSFPVIKSVDLLDDPGLIDGEGSVYGIRVISLDGGRFNDVLGTKLGTPSP